MARSTLRDALALERPLVTPLAHDALSARLIACAGFRAFAIGDAAMTPDPHAGEVRQVLDDALELERWQRIERKFADSSARAETER